MFESTRIPLQLSACYVKKDSAPQRTDRIGDHGPISTSLFVADGRHVQLRELEGVELNVRGNRITVRADSLKASTLLVEALEEFCAGYRAEARHFVGSELS